MSDTWRLVVDFPCEMGNTIRSESHRIGVAYQHMVKYLVDRGLKHEGITGKSVKKTRGKVQRVQPRTRLQKSQEAVEETNTGD